MLTNDIKQTLSQHFSTMKQPVFINLQTGSHSPQTELRGFLQEIANISDCISIKEGDFGLRSAISFSITTSEHQHHNIQFSGIPGGHEFNSLILSILRVANNSVNLDDVTISMLKKVSEPLHFEMFISLSCHNCPEVVQTLHQFAMINPLITAEMIDGGLHQHLIEKLSIQGVPTVICNEQPFVTGKVSTAQIIDNLILMNPHIKSGNKSTIPTQDVVVIGSGPAGSAAAIYTARKGLKTTILADKVGGQVAETVGIENLIGTTYTTGAQLTSDLTKHINEYNITVKENVRVTSVEKGDIKIIRLSNGEAIKSRSLIIATGAKWRELNIPGEKENVGSGVAYCPHCDAPFFKNKKVAVVGGGNSGVEAALDLANIVNHVTLLEYSDELKADDVLIQKALQHPKIDIATAVSCNEIISENAKVFAVQLTELNTKQIKTLPVDGVFVQIGLSPNSMFVKDIVNLNKNGEIIIDEKGRTSCDGIFACGDVTTVPYKQIVVAIGEGAKAGLSAFDYLSHRK